MTLNNKQVGELYMLLLQWGDVKFKDVLVTQRMLRLRNQLRPEAEVISATYNDSLKHHIAEYGVEPKDGGEKYIPAGSEGARIWHEEENRILNAGEFEVTEQFKYSELVVRERDPETRKLLEYPIELSQNDITRLGDIVVFDKPK